ncbi:MAG: M23 family metallopeptidase [Hyphomicrobiales bacterium]
MRKLLLAVLAAALVIGATACGGGGQGRAIVTIVTPTTPTPPPGSTPTPTPTPIPPPELILSTTQVYQAGAILVSVVGDVSGGTVTFINRTYPLTQGSQSMYTFVGVDADDPAGEQPLRVDYTAANGTKGTLTETITVLATEWSVDAVDIPDSKTDLLDPSIGNDELAMLHQIYSQVTPQKLWSGSWLVPVPGPLTTHFGEQRSYNGSEPSGHHGGTDIGAEEGTPVVATNAGRVVMARQVQLRGNMVIIDHGGGLFSGYAHLSAFAVAEGQMVAQGDVIGYVGTTGLSTGAHLHWEMAIDGVMLDAMRFTDGSNGF